MVNVKHLGIVVASVIGLAAGLSTSAYGAGASRPSNFEHYITLSDEDGLETKVFVKYETSQIGGGLGRTNTLTIYGGLFNSPTVTFIDDQGDDLQLDKVVIHGVTYENDNFWEPMIEAAQKEFEDILDVIDNTRIKLAKEAYGVDLVRPK